MNCRNSFSLFSISRVVQISSVFLPVVVRRSAVDHDELLMPRFLLLQGSSGKGSPNTNEVDQTLAKMQRQHEKVVKIDKRLNEQSAPIYKFIELQEQWGKLGRSFPLWKGGFPSTQDSIKIKEYVDFVEKSVADWKQIRDGPTTMTKTTELGEVWKFYEKSKPFGDAKKLIEELLPKKTALDTVKEYVQGTREKLNEEQQAILKHVDDMLVEHNYWRKKCGNKMKHGNHECWDSRQAEGEWADLLVKLSYTF